MATCAVPAGRGADRHDVDVSGLKCICEGCERLPATLGGQSFGPLQVDIDDSNQVDVVAQFVDHRPVDGADNASTDKGESESGGRVR